MTHRMMSLFFERAIIMNIAFKDIKALLEIFFTDEVVKMILETMECMSLGCSYDIPEEKIGIEAFKFKKE